MLCIQGNRATLGQGATLRMLRICMAGSPSSDTMLYCTILWCEGLQQHDTRTNADASQLGLLTRLQYTPLATQKPKRQGRAAMRGQTPWWRLEGRDWRLAKDAKREGWDTHRGGDRIISGGRGDGLHDSLSLCFMGWPEL